MAEGPTIKARLQQRAGQLKTELPAIFLTLKDPETPLLPKLLALLVVIYALSPIDLIPDFIPVIGYLDDLLLLPALIALTIRLLPKEVRERNRALAAEYAAAPMWKKRWCYAVPFVLLWLVLLLLAVRLILRKFG